jgi:hypothetical protein
MLLVFHNPPVVVLCKPRIVYDAISRLQQRHLIYNGIHYSKIHILHGKVRLSNIASIRYIKDSVKLHEEAARRHWTALDQLFNSLDPADEFPWNSLNYHSSLLSRVALLYFSLITLHPKDLVLRDFPQRLVYLMF